jgi:hypothetical protein
MGGLRGVAPDVLNREGSAHPSRRGEGGAGRGLECDEEWPPCQGHLGGQLRK